MTLAFQCRGWQVYRSNRRDSDWYPNWHILNGCGSYNSVFTHILNCLITIFVVNILNELNLSSGTYPCKLFSAYPFSLSSKCLALGIVDIYTTLPHLLPGKSNLDPTPDKILGHPFSEDIALHWDKALILETWNAQCEDLNPFCQRRMTEKNVFKLPEPQFPHLWDRHHDILQGFINLFLKRTQ